MILIDTNIVIDYLQGVDSILDDLLENEDIAICGIIVAALLHGINSDKQKTLIQDAVADFEWIPIDDSIWYAIGNNLNKLRRSGINIPFQDAILATVCIENNIEIATNDSHFEKISSVLTDLKIYK